MTVGGTGVGESFRTFTPQHNATEMKETSGLIKLNVFVVDDESAALQQLVDDLRLLPEVDKVYAFSSYKDTLSLLELQPDVLFLDVETPDRNGIDYVDMVQRRVAFPFHVVFYSAFSRYMLDAIRRSAFDFLLKPYKLDELHEIVKRLCRERFERPASACRMTVLLSPRRKIAVQTVRELLLLTVDDILLMRYDKSLRAWLITLTDDTTHRLHQGTKAEDLLAFHELLTRISSSCIVNVAYLSAVENSTLRCRMCAPFDGLELYASRRYFSRLKAKFELI